MTEADRVWNRAALENGGASPWDGDRALPGLLLAHGLVMNGGVRHACSSLAPDELRAAVSGYRFFGFEDIGRVLERSASSDKSDSDGDDAATVDPFDQEYARVLPSDGVLLERFKAIYAASTASFSPV